MARRVITLLGVIALLYLGIIILNRMIDQALSRQSDTNYSFGVTLSTVPVLEETPQVTLSPTRVKTVIVTAIRSLNVRESAGEDQAVIGNLYYGDVVSLAGECDQQGWVVVSLGDLTGWVNADYLTPSPCDQ